MTFLSKFHFKFPFLFFGRTDLSPFLDSFIPNEDRDLGRQFSRRRIELSSRTEALFPLSPFAPVSVGGRRFAVQVDPDQGGVAQPVRAPGDLQEGVQEDSAGGKEGGM